jgi:ketosteroid isomerase-like protein
MKSTYFLLAGFTLILVCLSINTIAQSENDIKAFDKLRLDLSAAFANGDVETITDYHHPDVVKALAYTKLLVGRTAIIEDLKTTLQYFSLNFKAHKIESFVVAGDMATEISTFTIEGTPKGDAKPFTFKGRSMVVYIRYKPSPVGWAIYWEMIQPATD